MSAPSRLARRDLDLHGAGGAVDRARRARHLALEGLAAQLGLGDDDLLPRLDQLRVRLRHVDVDAQRIHLGQHEQRLAAARRSGRRCRPLRRVITPANGAVTRLKPSIWRSRSTLASAAARLAPAWAAALRFSSSSCCETTSACAGLPALGGAPRQREAGGRLLARGDRLRQLLVDLGRLDLGEQLALLDRAPMSWSSASGSRWRGPRSATAVRPAACRAAPGSGRCRPTWRRWS